MEMMDTEYTGSCLRFGEIIATKSSVSADARFFGMETSIRRAGAEAPANFIAALTRR